MKSNEETYSNFRANDILKVILAYARLDFKEKTFVSEKEDVFDAISSGVNMLGEELENSKVSLKEKEQLLKEVHHRVKNNLQIISSLLNLQSDYVQDENFLTLIRESKNRINSMSLIHEMLYTSQNFSQINFKEYLDILYHSIYSTFERKELDIEFDLKVDENIHFAIDTMIPLGLILNEIMTNSFKYAFPNHIGKIKIEVVQSENKIKLIIADNGIGIPKEFDFENTKSIGIQLIHMLSDQIDAELKIESEIGTEYELII
ncbi:MAG: sensor histidine kinase [Bacteroidota bacterium]